MANQKIKQIDEIVEQSNNMRERERRLISEQHRMEQLVAAMRSRLSPPAVGGSGAADWTARSERAKRLRMFEVEPAA
jgi:hypothetical protein